MRLQGWGKVARLPLVGRANLLKNEHPPGG